MVHIHTSGNTRHRKMSSGFITPDWDPSRKSVKCMVAPSESLDEAEVVQDLTNKRGEVYAYAVPCLRSRFTGDYTDG